MKSPLPACPHVVATIFHWVLAHTCCLCAAPRYCLNTLCLGQCLDHSMPARPVVQASRILPGLPQHTQNKQHVKV